MKKPTPETDAVAAYEGNWDTKALRMTAHSRKLERERDEAKEAYGTLATEHVLAVNKLAEERDEAREQRDRLAGLAKQFVKILDITEESGGGRLFHPTNITSCRAGDLQKIGELVEALRRASNS